MAFALPTPEDNTQILGWTATGITLPQGQAARVTVTGYLHFTPNPGRVNFFGPPPAIPNPIGPSGGNWPWRDAERVRVRLHRPDGVLAEVALTPVWTPAAESIMGYVQGPGTFDVARPQGIAGAGTCYATWPAECPGGGYYLSLVDYFVAGQQELQVTPLDSAYIVPSRLRVQPGDTVTFEVKLDWTDEWGIRTTEGWWWVPEPDSTPAPPRPAGVPGPNWQARSPGCGLSRSCRFTITEQGHMEVGVGGPAGIRWRARSPLVTVGPPVPSDSLPRDSTPPPDSALALSISLSRDAITPVLAPLFDAVTQEASTRGTATRPAARTDTITVRIRAAYLPSRRPASGLSVTLVAAGLDGSGGHAHDTDARPSGTFFGDASAVDQARGGTRESVTVTLDSPGDATVTYRTSGLAGIERLTAQAIAFGHQHSQDESVEIRWPGLVPMERFDTYHEFKDQNPLIPAQRHGNANHFVARAFRDSVVAVFGRYFDSTAVSRRFPNANPDGGFDTRFVVTDASLEWGGLMDIALVAPWVNPHRRHRTGEDMDVRITTMDQRGRRMFRDICEDAQLSCEIHDGPIHWHIRPGVNQ
jgi:hypothetical protein